MGRDALSCIFLAIQSVYMNIQFRWFRFIQMSSGDKEAKFIGQINRERRARRVVREYVRLCGVTTIIIKQRTRRLLSVCVHRKNFNVIGHFIGRRRRVVTHARHIFLDTHVYAQVQRDRAPRTWS